MGIDNRQRILADISAKVAREKGELEESYKEKVKQAKQDAKTKLNEELSHMRETFEKRIEQLEKQKVNSFALANTQRLLKGRYALYDKTVSLAKELSLGEKALFERFIKELQAETHKDIQYFLVPKKSKLSGANIKAELDEPEVFAVLGENEGLDRSVNQLILAKTKAIHDVVMKELF